MTHLANYKMYRLGLQYAVRALPSLQAPKARAALFGTAAPQDEEWADYLELEDMYGTVGQPLLGRRSLNCVPRNSVFFLIAELECCCLYP